MNVIILLGAPGSGKGTTAEKISGESGCIHVSTGDMLRDAVKNGTGVGRDADSYMKRGELVPDSVMIKIVEERLDRDNPDNSYIFDGFPRTAAQAELLEQSLERRGGGITHVFLLDAPREVLIERLTGRRICRNCGTNYHIVNIPPSKEGVCDACGGELYQRTDDREATIVNRLEVYNKQTENLISRYERNGLLVRIDSNRPLDRIVAEITDILDGL